MSSQPFSGIRVVEFGQYIAVPYCGQLLAEGGAHVIKVEAPGGDPNRHMNQIAPGESRIFVSRNRGKHSLPLKLSDPAARPVIDALLASADVILTNFRPGGAARVGLDADEVLKKHPRIIIGDITPFGKKGPDADLAGMDVVVQGRSGLMTTIGRMEGDRPAPGDAVVADYMASMSLAYGIASALFRRERTGKGGIVDVSLMHAAMALANNQLTRSEDLDRDRHHELMKKIEEGRKEGMSFAEQRQIATGGQVFNRSRSLYFRSYNTATGPIAVSCVAPKLQDRFMEVVGLKDRGLAEDTRTLPADYYPNLQSEVEAIIGSRPAEHWLTALSDIGAPVAPVKLAVEMFEDEQATANDMFYIMEHPTAGRFRVLSPTVNLSDGGFLPPPATPPFASETTAILSELDLSAEEIEKLTASGVTVIAD